LSFNGVAYQKEIKGKGVSMKDRLSNEFKKNVYLKPDEYLNGWARKCGWKATLVYDSLWRHADKSRQAFPSVQLMAEEHGISRKSIEKGIKTLVDYNLVKREQKRSAKTGKFLYNTYTLTNKDKWKEPVPPHRGTAHRTPLESITVPPERDYKDTHSKDTHIIHKNVLRKKTYGNKEINLLIKLFKKRFDLPLLDGSEKQNRRYCHLAMVKFGGADKVGLLIDAAANSNFWATKISSFMDLYYKGVRIISETRKDKSKIAFINPR